MAALKKQWAWRDMMFRVTVVKWSKSRSLRRAHFHQQLNGDVWALESLELEISISINTLRSLRCLPMFKPTTHFCNSIMILGFS